MVAIFKYFFNVMVVAVLVMGLIDARDIRARYPVAFYQPEYIEDLDVDYVTVRIPTTFAHKTQEFQYREGPVRRRPQSSRFQNIFSNSRVIHGSEFVPKELAPYVGRMYDRRRQRETFRWAPPQAILDSTLGN